MNKKVLVTALLLSIGVVGFSQTSEIRTDNPKSAAKMAAENSTRELLDNMGRQLRDHGSKPKVNISVEGDKKTDTRAEQFLYQEDLIDSNLEAKSHALENVFNALCRSKVPSTEFTYDPNAGIYIDINKIAYKPGKKPGVVDSTTLIVPASFQTHAVAENGVSDVKYAVTFTWEVEVQYETKTKKVDGKKTKVSGYVPKGKPELVSSAAHTIDYLASDKLAMQAAARKAIIEWYANLPQTLDKQYAEQAIPAVEAMNVALSEITIESPQSQNFTVTEVPEVTVNIDPYQFIKGKESLYTDPKASIDIKPTFDISVDDTFKNAQITAVTYDATINEPVTDSVKMERSRAAKATIDELTRQLSSYVTSRDAEQKAAIENMFDSAESTVEVSHLFRNGTEKIKTESVHRYLSLLKGASLKFGEGSFDDGADWSSVTYTIPQEYQSKTYSDYTLKKIHMTYDSEKNIYLIDKIEVVENSTKTEL